MVQLFVEIELANHQDLFRAELGLISSDQVRRLVTGAFVDSSTMRMVIPATIAGRLGVGNGDLTKIRLADGSTTELVHEVHLYCGGRESVFNAIVEPAREFVTIGAIVLEDLDLTVDEIGRRLVPRDPQHITSYSESSETLLVAARIGNNDLTTKRL